MQEKRDRWPSRAIFVFAAIGSSVGLGNIWRFPYLVGKYGGGAFLVPYLLLLFAFGIPLLILEFALGQKTQQGAVGAMKKIRKRFSGVGLGATLCSFMVACYYAVVMAWCILYLFYSFDLSWGENAQEFFFQQVLNISDSPLEMSIIPTKILVALVACWVMVYFCIWKGVKSVSAVVTITMPLPIILLVVLLIRSSFLDGAAEGVVYFLTPNFGALLDDDVWMAAMTQIFFSLTVGFGVMITYGSYEKTKSDIVKNAFIIGVSDAAIALLSGLVVFSTLGHMAHTSGADLKGLAATGPSLAFIVFPKALSLIPGAPFFAFFFFITLLTLGIDSLFSLVEAITSVFHDWWPDLRKQDLTMYVCSLGFMGGLIFCTGAGIYYLDIADHFVTTYGLVIVTLLQALVVGWYFGADKIRAWINSVSDWSLGSWWSYSICYLAPLCLFVLLITGFYRDISRPYEGYSQWSLLLWGWGVVLLILSAGLGYSIYSGKKKFRRKKIGA